MENLAKTDMVMEKKEEKVGTIDIVIIKMMKYLSSSDLKNFRLVNRQWRDQATTILLKRLDLSIDFRFCEQRNAYYQQHQQQVAATTTIKKKKLDPTLEDLIKCIKGGSKNNFPCANFSFTRGDFVRDGYQLEQFFSLYGKNIKKLHLNLNDVLWPSCEPSPPLMFPIEIEEETTTEAHIKKLMCLLPNLKYLHIQSLPTEFWEFKQRDEDKEKGEKFVFSSLQILNLEGFKPLFDDDNYYYANSSNKKKNNNKRKRNDSLNDDDTTTNDINMKYCGFLDLILKSAENFTTENWKLEFLREYDANPKALETIKSFNCIPTRTNLEYLEKYSHTNLKLEQFGFHLENIYDLPIYSWNNIIPSMNRILKSSSDTMKKISYFQPLGFFEIGGGPEEIEIPSMNVLESIEFGEKPFHKGLRFHRKNQHNEMFPSLKQFEMTRELFPTLKKISFSFSKVERESFLNKYFKNFLVNPVLMKGLEIEFSQQLPDSVVENLAVLFPFVEGISIKNVTNFHDLSKRIFKYFHQNLLSLKLSGNILSSCCGNNFNSLDSTITGIPQQVCDRLKMKLDEDAAAGSSRFVVTNTFLDLNSDSTTTNEASEDNDDEVVDNLQTSKEILLNMREFPSIRDMKKLEIFTLELSEVSTMNWFLPNSAIFSRVADVYGFSLMPLLKVKIILKDLPDENRVGILKKFQDISSNSMQVYYN